MQKTKKSQKEILEKLRIEQLNPMQEEAKQVIHSHNDIIILSPTGTGKTLAFLLPIIAELKDDCQHIQVMILVPSRELAIQIDQVIKEMGTGYKSNAVYGGRAGSKEKLELKTPPAILVGTPGRVADHLRRERLEMAHIHTLVLDEFDKSLEVGFEREMKEIITALPEVQKRILTSATQKLQAPEFVGLSDTFTIDYLKEENTQLEIKTFVSPEKDKLDTLVDSLCHIGNKAGIIFCNFRESIERVSEFLNANEIKHGCFHGGMEQIDRETTLIKFRNRSHQLIIATDLAARGLDIKGLDFIIHYQLPSRNHEFLHRNGRTARMNSQGTAYIIKWKEEKLPDFVGPIQEEIIQDAPIPDAPEWSTVYINGGRRDKISKGDIVGLFFKQGKLEKDELGIIELKNEAAYVGIKTKKAQAIVDTLNNSKLKKKKIRLKLI